MRDGLPCPLPGRLSFDSLGILMLDYNGNVTAQLEYSKMSSRWKFPSLYYTQTFTLDGGHLAEFVFLDTSLLISPNVRSIHDHINASFYLI